MSRLPKVGSRVVEFGAYAGLFTVAALGYSKVYGKSEEDKQEELRRKYPDLVGQSQGSKKAMQQFFDSVKANKDDPNNQKKFDQLLHGGKGKMKRQGSNVGLEDKIKPVAKPVVIPLKDKEKEKEKKEKRLKKKEKEQKEKEKKGWFW